MEVDKGSRIQIMYESIRISHRANTLQKGLSSTNLLPAMSKIEGQTVALLWQPV